MYQYTRYFRGLSAEFNEQMRIAEVCISTGWDYWTYLRQPVWLIDTIEARAEGQNDAALLLEEYSE